MGTTANLTQVFYGASNPAATEITGIISVNVPKLEIPKVPTTNLSSTVETSQGGLPGYGEMTVKYQYTAALFNTIAGLAGVTKFWRIGLPDTSGTVDFQGYITGHECSYDDNNKIVDATLTVQITGAITITVGS